MLQAGLGSQQSITLAYFRGMVSIGKDTNPKALGALISASSSPGDAPRLQKPKEHGCPSLGMARERPPHPCRQAPPHRCGSAGPQHSSTLGGGVGEGGPQAPSAQCPPAPGAAAGPPAACPAPARLQLSLMGPVQALQLSVSKSELSPLLPLLTEGGATGKPLWPFPTLQPELPSPCPAASGQ